MELGLQNVHPTYKREGLAYGDLQHCRSPLSHPSGRAAIAGFCVACIGHPSRGAAMKDGTADGGELNGT